MRSKLVIYVLFFPLLVFFSIMLYIEVSMYDVLPYAKGGMSIWQEFRSTSYRSVWLYAILLTLLFLAYLHWFSNKE